MISILYLIAVIVFTGGMITVVYDSILQSKKSYKLEMVDELVKRGFKEEDIL